MRKLLTGAAVAVPALFLPLALPAAVAAPARSSAAHSSAVGSDPAGSDLAAMVTLKDVRAHLAAFQEIADYNGGNRAAGTAGYDVSVKYVVGRLRRAGYAPKVQRFTYPYWRERGRPVLARTAPTAASYTWVKDFLTFAYSGSGDVTARAEPVDVPANGEGTSGCQKSDFRHFAEGAIALLQRGGCTFQVKAANAKAAGASAVVIFNRPGEEGPVNGTVSEPSGIPAVGTTHRLGTEMVKAARKSNLRLHVKTRATQGKRTSANVIADTARGRARNVVVAGAHLDSVPAGPGINDNGTGAAALLAIAEKLGRLGAEDVRNRVRFAWWGAEEEGLRGSAHYVASLSRADRERIALNLNFDMLGSPNGVRGVYDGDHSEGKGTRPPAGSGAIERMFRTYFKRRGLATAEAEFNGRSDYGPFIERGIPAGGIATGAGGRKTASEAAKFGGKAGTAYDSCYHRECDRLGNVDLKLLDGNTDAIAHVLQHLARTTIAVNGGARLAPGRAPSSAPVWRGPYLLR